MGFCFIVHEMTSVQTQTDRRVGGQPHTVQRMQIFLTDPADSEAARLTSILTTTCRPDYQTWLCVKVWMCHYDLHDKGASLCNMNEGAVTKAFQSTAKRLEVIIYRSRIKWCKIHDASGVILSHDPWRKLSIMCRIFNHSLIHTLL